MPIQSSPRLPFKTAVSIKPRYALRPDGFWIDAYNSARPFSSFLPGIAGELGKPMWVFYANRGQCVAGFGVRNKNGAMMEFFPANKAYAQTPLTGFRTFVRFAGPPALYEPFHVTRSSLRQRLRIRPEEIELEDTDPVSGLRVRAAFFTLPNDSLPVLVRQVTVENTGRKAVRADVLDGMPQVVPYGLIEYLLKQMSRTMEAFAEIRHNEDQLPFFKLKTEPSDKPDVQWIHGGFFAFTVKSGRSAPIVVDPDQVFGSDSSLQSPLHFASGGRLNPQAGRRESMTGCAMSLLKLALRPGESAAWDSYYGQADAWEASRDFRTRVLKTPGFAARKREENTGVISSLTEQFALHAGPATLDAYSRQTFLDNTLRGGRPIVIEGPRGPRLFHSLTRKHGDMERDYNFFEVSPTYYSQGNGNFRDVNQNRRSENFLFSGVGSANIETFFNLLQLDGQNPLVIQYEKFFLPPSRLNELWKVWPEGRTPAWETFLTRPFNPGQLLEELAGSVGSATAAQPLFERIIGLADKVQDAAHGEGYWLDHWIYNLDLLETFEAFAPDQVRALLLERNDFTYFDSDHVVQPRDKKYVLRKDGAVRQLHAVVKDAEKARLIAKRTADPSKVRTRLGEGDVYHTTLAEKLLCLTAVKASTLDPDGIGLEMEAEKPGWCDALNGLPALFGSSTHEAFALRRAVAWASRHLESGLAGQGLPVALEVAALVRSVADILHHADPDRFFPTWQALAERRETYRAEVRLGVVGEKSTLTPAELAHFFGALKRVLDRGLAKAFDAKGLCISYFTREAAEFERLPQELVAPGAAHETPPTHVVVKRFVSKPLSAFLEGSVQALRSMNDGARARSLYKAVRRSSLYDAKLGMYRLNVPLDQESFEIGRNKIFSPGWLENESIFLHMHYKYLLETLRSGLAAEFFEDLKTGLVAFQKPERYGRSPLENSSFIASSRFPDPGVHGAGFVARLTGATAEWISMVLHMGLGANPFQVVEGALRFAPQPTLADWLFTVKPSQGLPRDTFGFKFLGQTWIVYHNPKRRSTYGAKAVAPVSFALEYRDGRRTEHAGPWLPASLAHDLRSGLLSRLLIRLDLRPAPGS